MALFWSEPFDGSEFTQSKCQSACNTAQGLIWLDLCHLWPQLLLLSLWLILPRPHLFPCYSLTMPDTFQQEGFYIGYSLCLNALSSDIYMANALMFFKSHLHCTFSDGSILTTLSKMAICFLPANSNSSFLSLLLFHSFTIAPVIFYRWSIVWSIF